MKLLHVIASPRLDGSRTLGISQALLDELAGRIPDLEIETLDLFQEDLPAIAGDNIDAKYTLLARMPIGREHAESWAEIEREIERFRRADAYVISTPMWNFGIPYVLKYYIDCIVQPGYLFRFTEQGYPEPLLEDRPTIVVSSSGSDYSDATPMKALDFLEPYLRTIFGFVGLQDLTFIRAHGVDVSEPARDAALAGALEEVRALAASDRWLRVAA
ncbi:NAD(P)H-dependent oxidoreductase [Microbacterium sp. AZCO]|uniref:FMN-dependent NADH-azoreductase n=1 Tax=Microbacterium sp. AZCO TaxID=3142976 RepID=UPI0031F38D0E